MATWTNPPTFSAGGTATASDMNTLGSDLALVGKPPAVYAYQTTAQTGIATGTATPTKVTFDSTYINQDGMYVAATSKSKLTVVTAGYYLLSGLAAFNEPGSANTGLRWAVLYKNNSQLSGGAVITNPISATSSYTFLTTPQLIVNCAAGDYLELGIFHTQGANIGTYVGGAYCSSLTAQWVSA